MNMNQTIGNAIVDNFKSYVKRLKGPYEYSNGKFKRPDPIKVKISGKTEIIEWSHPLYDTINYYGKTNKK